MSGGALLWLCRLFCCRSDWRWSWRRKTGASWAGAGPDRSCSFRVKETCRCWNLPANPCRSASDRAFPRTPVSIYVFVSFRCCRASSINLLSVGHSSPPQAPAGRTLVRVARTRQERTRISRPVRRLDLQVTLTRVLGFKQVFFFTSAVRMNLSVRLQPLIKTAPLRTPTNWPIRGTRTSTDRDTPPTATRHGPSSPATSTRRSSEAAAGSSPTWTVWGYRSKEPLGEEATHNTQQTAANSWKWPLQLLKPHRCFY